MSDIVERLRKTERRDCADAADEIERLRVERTVWAQTANRETNEIERLRRLLSEARRYVADAGNDEDSETQTLSGELLAEIDRSGDLK